MKKKGFFGGTFDPPHFAHIYIVLSLLEQGQVEEIFVCPTASSTTKPEAQIIASPQERLAMTRLAFAGIPNVTVIEEEIFQTGPVYTIDTLRSLRKQFPTVDWAVIVGEDVASQVSEWKEGELLVKEFSLIIYPRHSIPRVIQNLANSEVSAPQFDQAKPTAKQGSVLHSPDAAWAKSGDADTGIGQILNYEGYIAISSTEVRNRIRKNLFCEHLVRRKVLDFIEEKLLYCGSYGQDHQ